jgi:hypothetical protein
MGLGGRRQAQAALPPGKGPCTHCIGGWVGPRASLVNPEALQLYEQMRDLFNQ